MDGCVFRIWGLSSGARPYPSCAERCGQNEFSLPDAFELRFLLLGPSFELFLSGLEFVEEERFERGVFGVHGEAAGAGVEGFREFVEGKEGEGGAVEGFDILGVEAEGGGAVESRGAVVFLRFVSDLVSNQGYLCRMMLRTYLARGCKARDLRIKPLRHFALSTARPPFLPLRLAPQLPFPRLLSTFRRRQPFVTAPRDLGYRIPSHPSTASPSPSHSLSP